MRKLIFSLTTILLTTGCGSMNAYLPIIDASIVGGRSVVQAAKDYTVTKDDVVGCYVTSALVTAFDTSKATIDSWVTSSEGNREIPGVEVDIAACHLLVGDKIQAVLDEDVSRKVEGILKAVMPSVTGVLGAVLESNGVTCRDVAIARGVLKYLENATPVVLAELANPDGKMSLPAVVLDLEGCDTSSTDPAPKDARASACLTE